MLNRLFVSGKSCSDKVSKGALIVDVRSPGEFNTGHVKGSINVPIDTIHAQVNKLLKKERPLVLCCASGMRSARATRILKTHGLDACNGGSWKSLNH